MKRLIMIAVAGIAAVGLAIPVWADSPEMTDRLTPSEILHPMPKYVHSVKKTPDLCLNSRENRFLEAASSEIAANKELLLGCFGDKSKGEYEWSHMYCSFSGMFATENGVKLEFTALDGDQGKRNFAFTIPTESLIANKLVFRYNKNMKAFQFFDRCGEVSIAGDNAGQNQLVEAIFKSVKK